jgi:hypothetical protein
MDLDFVSGQYGCLFSRCGDTAYDTDFAMFYALYHIFKQESIQGRGTIKGRGMIKGRHLALYQILKTTVFTTKYMIKGIYILTYHPRPISSLGHKGLLDDIGFSG